VQPPLQLRPLLLVLAPKAKLLLPVWSKLHPMTQLHSILHPQTLMVLCQVLPMEGGASCGYR
jgi:hypothetical protein